MFTPVHAIGGHTNGANRSIRAVAAIGIAADRLSSSRFGGVPAFAAELLATITALLRPTTTTRAVTDASARRVKLDRPEQVRADIMSPHSLNDPAGSELPENVRKRCRYLTPPFHRPRDRR
jgi:hypothetical protein